MTFSPEQLMERDGVVRAAFRLPGSTRTGRNDHRRPRPQIINAAALDVMKFDPIKYVVPGYIAEGCTILAGRPKLGKSWFVLEAALAVASGGTCLGGIECEEGDVLYLALEDNRRRLQSRMRRLRSVDAMGGVPMPSRLHLATEWPRASEGGIDEIRTWLVEHPGARLVVVDVLAMFKSIGKGKDQTLYEADYTAVKELQSLASERGVAIVVVHHTRKSGSDVDPFEKVSGTLGLSGAADTTLVLDRDQNGATLYGRGRDIEEIETAVTFDRDSCTWKALGAVIEVRRTDERSVIVNALRDNQDAMSPTELADALGLPRNNVKQLLFKMAKTGDVQKAKRGRYAHPDFCGYGQKDTRHDNFDNHDNQLSGELDAAGASEAPVGYREPDADSQGGNRTAASDVLKPATSESKVTAVTEVIGYRGTNDPNPEQAENPPSEVEGAEYDCRVNALIAGCGTDGAKIVLMHKQRKGAVIEDAAGAFWTRGRA